MLYLRRIKVSMAIIVLVAVTMLFTGCSLKFRTSKSIGTSSMSSSFSDMTGEKSKEMTFERGGTYDLSYETRVNDGDMMVQLIDPKGQVILILDSTSEGHKEIAVAEGETYKILVTGDHGSGRYNFNWKLK